MPGRKLSLEHIIRDHKLDFVGVQETKKEVFPINFLKKQIKRKINPGSYYERDFMEYKRA
jgi:hypothetical protein